MITQQQLRQVVDIIVVLISFKNRRTTVKGLRDKIANIDLQRLVEDLSIYEINSDGTVQFVCKMPERNQNLKLAISDMTENDGAKPQSEDDKETKE